MKRTLLWLLILSLPAMLSIAAAFAAGNNSIPSDEFFDICDHLFTEGSGYKAIDKNGADVTSQFVRDYREDYLSGDYEIIFDAVTKDLKYITWK